MIFVEQILFITFKGYDMKIKQIEHVTAGDVVCSHGHAYRVLKNIFDANGNTGCQPRHVLICVGATGTEPFAQKMDIKPISSNK